MPGEQEEQVQVKKKYIIFRKPGSKDILAKMEVPTCIRLAQNQTCDLLGLRNRLKMLYIDILFRGYHPIKGFELNARNVFKHEDLSTSKNEETKIPISNNEAIGTIWRCLAREVGRPLKNYNMNRVRIQLDDELLKLKKASQITHTQLSYTQDSKLKNEYSKLVGQLAGIRSQILAEMENIAAECKTQDENAKPPKKHVVKAMESQIVELQHSIFLQTLVGIRQWKENVDSVEFVMEQSYPYRNMGRKNAIQMLGEEVFNQKWAKYQQCVQKYELTTDNITVCHRCLTPLNNCERIVGCNDLRSSHQVYHTVLTDPFIYSNQVINENCHTQKTQKFIHPYLVYYFQNDSNSSHVCNRYYCNKCEGLQSSLSTTGNCNYCDGLCDCSRCQGMDSLTKMMAVFIDNGGCLPDITKQFWMTFDTKILNLKNKKNTKSRNERFQEFRQYCLMFQHDKIFVKKKDIQNFEKTLYFSQRIEDDAQARYQKYKMTKIPIPKSQEQRLQMQALQHKYNQQTLRLNKIALGGRQIEAKIKKTKKTNGTENDEPHSSHSSLDKTKINTKNKSSNKDNNSRSVSPEKSRQSIDCYYQDSDT